MSLPHLHHVPAPAKLNLFLHVVGQRADGYHLLQSVFMLIDWQDELHIDRRADGQLTRHDLNPGAPALPEQDLVLRAARLLQQASGCQWGADITLDKQIPQEAGMGGGSSDAASTLMALNHLWGLHWPTERLQALGLQLGADVPFFLGGDNAWVEGIGDRLTPIALPEGRFLVLKPPVGVSTPAIFRSPELKRDSKTVTMREFSAANDLQPFGFGHNDLQPVAQSLCPLITDGLDWLHSRQLSGRMTGSGSAIFAPVQSDISVSDLPSGWTARCCKNLREHPVKTLKNALQ